MRDVPAIASPGFALILDPFRQTWESYFGVDGPPCPEATFVHAAVRRISPADAMRAVQIAADKFDAGSVSFDGVGRYWFGIVKRMAEELDHGRADAFRRNGEIE